VTDFKAKIANKIKLQISKFSGIISKVLQIVDFAGAQTWAYKKEAH